MLWLFLGVRHFAAGQKIGRLLGTLSNWLGFNRHWCGRYCQVDVEWTKLAPAKPSGRPELLYEGSTGHIAPRGEGVIAGRPVLTGGQTMAAELEVVVDLSVN
jgi:hypothetical protein